MLTLVLATALTAATSAPGTHFYSGCYGCYGCHGGYPYAVAIAKPVSYGCWGGSSCFGGCFGGCYGGCYGCGGGYGGCHGCGGCWGTFHAAYAGCGGCCGAMTYAPSYACCGGCCGISYAPSYACCGGCCGVLYVPSGCCGTVIGIQHMNAGPPVKVIEKTTDAPDMKKVEDGKKGNGKKIEDEKKGDGKKIEGEETAARLTVRAAADVAVTVNGVRLARKGETETFRTPGLVPGTEYSYTVVASVRRGGREVSETKQVPVVAGGRAEVDFSALGATPASASVTIVADKGTPVRVNGTAVTVDGKRTFETPALEAGRSYFYTVEAEVTKDGKKVTESRRVEVKPGNEVTVDLRTPTAVAAR